MSTNSVASVEASFLPAMLEIARQKNIELICFRVKRKPVSETQLAKEGHTYDEYLEALRAYIEKGAAKLIDESRDADVTIDFYGSDDHVAPAKMKAYTELFWRKIKPQLKSAGTEAER